MIWLIFFFFFLIIKLKSFMFISNFLELDSPSSFMGMICPLIIFLIFTLKISTFSLKEENSFFFFFLLITLFVFACFLLKNSYYFILSLEFCVLPMISLIFFFSKGVDKIISVFFMFLINILGSLPFMIFFSSQDCIVFLSYSFSEFFLLNFNSLMIFFFFILVMICKLPLFLFHFWLTKAHVSAAGSCSMILASLMLKLGSFGLLKFSSLFLKVSSFNLSLIFSVSTWGTFLILAVMSRFFDIKYLIACSSIVHMSMIFPLICYNFSMGLISSIFMMVGHGLVSFILFYLISVTYEVSQNRSFDLNKSMESNIKNLAALIFVYLFLNLGVPPFLNFFSELFTVLTLLNFSSFNCFIMVIMMIIPIMFCMQMTTKTFFGKKIMGSNLDVSYYVLNYSIFFIFILILMPFIFF